MVLVLNAWSDFKDYLRKWGYLAELVYRIDPADSGATRIRVAAGRYGLDLRIEKGDPTLQEVKDFLVDNNGKRLGEAKDFLAFFS